MITVRVRLNRWTRGMTVPLGVIAVCSGILMSGCKMAITPQEEPLDSSVTGEGGNTAAGGSTGVEGGSSVTGGSPAPSIVRVTLAASQYGPRDLSANSGNLYWCNLVPMSTTPEDGVDSRIMSLPTTGGTPVTLAVAATLDPGGCCKYATDDTSVYYISGREDVSLFKAPLNGGAPELLATGFAQGPVAVDPDRVYGFAPYADTPDGATPDGYSIVSVPLAGGEKTVVVPETELPYWIAHREQLAVKGNELYWLNGTAPCRVLRAPIAGGPPSEFARVTGGSCAMAFDARTLFVGSDKALVAVPLDGSAPTTLYGSSLRAQAALGEYVYFTNALGPDDLRDSFLRVPKTGGPVTVLESWMTWLGNIVSDETSVYLIISGLHVEDGQIVKYTP